MGNFNPKLPTRHTGTNKYITFFVSRDRSPTTADYRQPETGTLYSIGTVWQVGKNPTTGAEGDLWMLSKIVANQAYWVMFSFGPLVATSYVTQNGTAIPSLNTLIVNGFDSSENNDNGIITKGGVLGTGTSNEVDVILTNRQTATVATSDATLTTILTIPLGATPAVYFIFGNVQAFNASTPAGASYGFSGGVRTTGAAAIEIATEYHDEFEEAAFVTADIFLTVSGNNALLQVQGVVGLDVNWNSILEYRMVT